MAAEDSPFLTRWSRRKTQARDGVAPALEPAPAVAPQAVPAVTVAAPAAPAPVAALAQPAAAPAATPPAPPPPPPTLADVAQLTRGSDYSRFVAGNVAPEVKNAALKRLFTDPHFNVMDGLDTYIEDYGKPDPLPAGMLRQMVQSHVLGLFADEEPATAPQVTAIPATPDTLVSPPPPAAARLPLPLETAPDEDTDLQLQSDDDARRTSADPGAGHDAGRQH